MTALGKRLIRRIGRTGPMSVAEYMTECLLHPELGFYVTRDPLGSRGDFTTAPEISQMFGELLGLSLAQCWLDQGAPRPFVLAEPGPGRGTLMADILRATARVPGFHDALDLHLVEASPALRALQKERLGAARPRWHDTLAALPEGPLLLIANEFFDALPIRQFLRQGDGWRERQIGVADGRLAFGLGGPVAPPELSRRLADTREGQIVETCAPALAQAGEISRRIAAHGGAAIILDYGGWRSLGDTLQAVREHAPDPVLAHPGEADLTAHVDFEAIARAGEDAGAEVTQMIPQGVLLERLGITERARVLSGRLSGPALESHIAAHRRLTHPDEMGTLFKAIAFHAKGMSAPPGFVR